MVVVVGILGLSGCGGAPAAEAPGVLAADPWVRTTDGAEMPEMTAVFVSLTNPTKDDRVLKSADCGDVAASTELHVMEKVDGQMVMKKSEDGIVVPAGKHEHLAPGGPHIMLMGLTRELPAGSEELACTLTFDDSGTASCVSTRQLPSERSTSSASRRRMPIFSETR